MPIAVIGHITKDIIEINGKSKSKPGGTALYSGIALARLGIKTQVFTKLAEKDKRLLDGLRHKNVELIPRFCRNTMRFRNVYHGEKREQYIDSIAEPFTIEDVGKLDAAIAHVGPLAKNDVPLDLLKHLKSLGIIVSLDVQGFVRTVREKKVKKTRWKEAKKFLNYVDILKADVAEAASIAASAKAISIMGPLEVMITNGSKGSAIYSKKQDKQWKIPAFRPSIARDVTGAGDTYVAGYIASRLCNDDLKECGRFAAMCATMKIESGVFSASKKDVENRLKKYSPSRIRTDVKGSKGPDA